MASNSGILIPPSTPPATVAVTNDIRPLKPPVAVPNPWFWVFLSVGILLTLAVIGALIALWLRAKARRPAVPPVPPHVRAREKLDAAHVAIGIVRGGVDVNGVGVGRKLRAAGRPSDGDLRRLIRRVATSAPIRQPGLARTRVNQIHARLALLVVARVRGFEEEDEVFAH